MCERDVAAWSPLLSPAAEPTGRQTPTVSLNMPSRRLNGTASWLPSANVFLVKMSRRTSRNTESIPEEYQSWSTEMSVSWKCGEHRTPRNVIRNSWLRWSRTTT